MEMEIEKEVGNANGQEDEEETTTTTTTTTTETVSVMHMSGECYPSPEAEYQQLVDNPHLFDQSLRNFHSSFRTTTHFLSPPCVAGTSIDLHRLFVEVTSRGGLDQVIRDRKWEEVISTLKFGISSVRGSFLLRKCYVSLLYHFEQAYYLRKASTPAVHTDAVNQISVVGSTVESTTTSFFQGPQIEPGFSLVGVIDEKFDNGYVVSVNVGSDKLKGILYHIPDRPQPSWSPNPCIPQRRKRKKSRLSLLDPSKVKPTSNNYDFFTEPYASLKPLPQGQENSPDKTIGHFWNKMSETEKQFYQDPEVRNAEHGGTNIVNSSIGS